MDNTTRPIVLLDTQNRQLYAFATQEYSGQTSGAVFYKQVSLDNASAQFPTGLGTAFTTSPGARRSFTMACMRAGWKIAAGGEDAIEKRSGPAVAGVLVAQLGEAMAFTLNGVSFLAVIAGLAMMALPPFMPSTRPDPLTELRQGLSYIAGNRTVLALGIVAAIPSIFGFSYSALLPVMAGDVLGLGADGYGGLVSAVGLGALVAGVSLAAMGALPRKGRLLTVATFVFALGLAVFAISHWVILSVVALALAGWAMVTHLATTNTLLQLEIPDALRGRVMSAYIWCVAGSAPLGAVFYGELAQARGAPFAMVVGAVICALSAAAVLVFFPHVRKLA